MRDLTEDDKSAVMGSEIDTVDMREPNLEIRVCHWSSFEITCP